MAIIRREFKVCVLPALLKDDDNSVPIYASYHPGRNSSHRFYLHTIDGRRVIKKQHLWLLLHQSSCTGFRMDPIFLDIDDFLELRVIQEKSVTYVGPL